VGMCNTGVYMKKSLLVFLIIVSFSSFADLKIKTEVDYYKFTGGTVNEMRRSLNRNGIRQGSMVYHGFANYWIRWRFNPKMQDGKCHMASVDLEVKNVLTLPRWSKPWFSKVDKKAETKLKKYLKALDYHERGHEKISNDGAKTMYAALTKIPPENNCNALLNKANQLARQYMTKIAHKQRAYDAATDHGRTQGAYFR